MIIFFSRVTCSCWTGAASKLGTLGWPVAVICRTGSIEALELSPTLPQSSSKMEFALQKYVHLEFRILALEK